MQYRHIFNHYFKPHLSYYRHNWNNGADATCYIGSDSETQSLAPQAAKDKQKKESQKNIVEQYAHMSAAACAKVCEAEGLDISTEEFTALDSEAQRGKLVRAKYLQKRRKDPSFRLDRKCFQWRFYSGICCTASEFSFGAPTAEASSRDEMVTSGWFVRGIQDWADAMGNCKADWKEPMAPS